MEQTLLCITCKWYILQSKGKAEGKMRLRRKQIEVAMSGQPAMLIFLGKCLLSQSESPVAEQDKILPWSDDATE